MIPDSFPKQARALEGRNAFHDFLSDFYAMRRAMFRRHGDIWEPPTDVYETAEHIVIKMSIPGIQPKHVAVECNGDVVTICGVREGTDPRSVVTYHCMEIRNGYFERRIVLHGAFDPRNARAEYNDGFLYVFIPKALEPVRHVVSIRLTL